jgi:hypothetical protein
LLSAQEAPEITLEIQHILFPLVLDMRKLEVAEEHLEWAALVVAVVAVLLMLVVRRVSQSVAPVVARQSEIYYGHHILRLEVLYMQA